MNECDKERGDSHRGGARVITLGLEDVKAIDLYLGKYVMRNAGMEPWEAFFVPSIKQQSYGRTRTAKSPPNRALTSSVAVIDLKVA